MYHIREYEYLGWIRFFKNGDVINATSGWEGIQESHLIKVSISAFLML